MARTDCGRNILSIICSYLLLECGFHLLLHYRFHVVLVSTQRQARNLISGPSPTAKTRLLSFYRTQSRDVTDLLTGYNKHHEKTPVHNEADRQSVMLEE
jgi:hypothetical protein